MKLLLIKLFIYMLFSFRIDSKVINDPNYSCIDVCDPNAPGCQSVCRDNYKLP